MEAEGITESISDKDLLLEQINKSTFFPLCPGQVLFLIFLFQGGFCSTTETIMMANFLLVLWQHLERKKIKIKIKNHVYLLLSVCYLYRVRSADLALKDVC